MGILAVVAGACLHAMTMTAGAQTVLALTSASTIGEYTVSGSVINSSFITGVNSPTAITVSDGYVYAASYDSNMEVFDAATGAEVNSYSIGFNPWFIAVSGSNLFATYWANPGVYDYNASTGALITSSFVASSGPCGLALSGNNLYVANAFTGSISEYDATTGDVINESLITGLNSPLGIAVSGNSLYVSQGGGGGGFNPTGEYDATTGDTINADFITSVYAPWGIAVSGTVLMETNNSVNTINEFNSTTGDAIGSFPIEGSGIAVNDVPEPSTWAMLMAGAGALALFRKRR